MRLKEQNWHEFQEFLLKRFQLSLSDKKGNVKTKKMPGKRNQHRVAVYPL